MLGSGQTAFRSFFRFQVYPGEADSTEKNNTSGGFTFAVLPGSQQLEYGGVSVCGLAGENGEYLGYKGLGSNHAHKFGVEFDLHHDAELGDPSDGNHVALLVGDSVAHAESGNPACTSDGCMTGAEQAWLEQQDGEYAARIEVQRNDSCSINGVSGNAQIQVWVCNPETACQTTASFANIEQAYTGNHGGLSSFKTCFDLPEGESLDMQTVQAGFTMASGSVPIALAVRDLKLFPYAVPLHWPFDSADRGQGIEEEAHTFSSDNPVGPDSGEYLVLPGETGSGGIGMSSSDIGDVATQNLAFSTWLRLSQDPVEQGIVIGKGGSGAGDPGYRLTVDADGFAHFQVASGVVVRSVSSERPLVTDLWYHVAAVLDRRSESMQTTDQVPYQVRLFINGVNQDGNKTNDDSSLKDQSLSNGGNLTIGSDLKGWLDDLRYYNYALSGGQVRYLQNIRGDSSK
ncbi:LamG-like jellyroll fold domain-containing protein [Desulfurispira natronophila]|uniref:LamG-like jellyroll fold domain-containing protein n=1 Tax=Desulfurispira natronophila TaxID=682562 RepID=A0A7W7Y6Y1_9BACT|nr:LamG-like jellyroll fold domain-containing protein [Desulfurispira natronophila]MBB5022872.1 hypothetical protein [Desulfurispira natronophila]